MRTALLAAARDEAGFVPIERRDGFDRIAPDLTTPARLRELALGSTALVFSASCGGAGLGLGVARDEMAGLPAAWLEAGAAGMISSLYVVVRDPAAAIMRLTFEALLDQGLSATQALRRAQIRYRQSRENIEEHVAPVEPRPDPEPSPGKVTLDAGHTRIQAPPEPPINRRRKTPKPTAHVAAFVLFGQ